jgi:hypothetical protein
LLNGLALTCAPATTKKRSTNALYSLKVISPRTNLLCGADVRFVSPESPEINPGAPVVFATSSAITRNQPANLEACRQVEVTKATQVFFYQHIWITGEESRKVMCGMPKVEEEV